MLQVKLQKSAKMSRNAQKFSVSKISFFQSPRFEHHVRVRGGCFQLWSIQSLCVLHEDKTRKLCKSKVIIIQLWYTQSIKLKFSLSEQEMYNLLIGVWVCEAFHLAMLMSGILNSGPYWIYVKVKITSCMWSLIHIYCSTSIVWE